MMSRGADVPNMVISGHRNHLMFRTEAANQKKVVLKGGEKTYSIKIGHQVLV